MVHQFTLTNGLRVIAETLPHLRSVSIGVWVRAGSILEKPAENGLSHFIEHLAFKGTARRSARQIAQEMDAVGGYLNAATSKLSTVYYAKVIDEDLPLAADILADSALLDEAHIAHALVPRHVRRPAPGPDHPGAPQHHRKLLPGGYSGLPQPALQPHERLYCGGGQF